MRSSARGAIGGLLLLLTVVGCGEKRISPQGSQAAITYMTIKNTGDSTLVSTRGRLQGDPISGCLWIELPRGERYQIHLRGHYVVRWEPRLRLYRDGKEVASEGEFVKFHVEGPTGKALVGCPVGPIPRAGSTTVW